MRWAKLTMIAVFLTVTGMPSWAQEKQSSEAVNYNEYFATKTARKAKQNWMLNCQGCHAIDGSGRPEKGLPDLNRSVANFLNVEGGREYLSRVPGVTNASLDDADLAEVINWVLIKFDPEHLPKDFTHYTAAEVAGLRGKPLATQAEATRNILLAKLAKKERQ
ncbi:MAG: cytochrome C [Robiginitomaculum sp.]|nr:MAG: cytochrome C [Robiginitomaculum sp.]